MDMNRKPVMFIPILKMRERINVSRQDSDASLFLDLICRGEFIIKLVVSGLIAGIQDDRERHRYRQLHRLVRADGLGDWATSLEDVLTGPASQSLLISARDEQRDLMQKCGDGSWQYEAIKYLVNCMKILDKSYDALPIKIDGRRWLSIFVQIRNKTKGHGAHTSSIYTKICPLLEKSMNIFEDNFNLFKREWAYLHRNLSGRYRVTKLTESSSYFDPLKSSNNYTFTDGIYVHYDVPCFVELLKSSVDAQDFLVPNGGFTENKYENISYITGNREQTDSTPYLTPSTDLPQSVTQGIGILDIQGKSYANLPPMTTGYIYREEIEKEVYDLLSIQDRHPIITLTGRGGIGKTSLALSVLHKIALCEIYNLIIWFSARDIDLLTEGPKLVKPQVLTEYDMAKEFVRLLAPKEVIEKVFNPLEYFQEYLTKSKVGPILFIFDNFETVRNPAELYKWIDTYVRLPNKILITTRHREFRGDYPIEITGMNEKESYCLIDSLVDCLNIGSIVNQDYKKIIYKESDGHPYVIKIYLGEVAKSGKQISIEKTVANKEEILDALFERTYNMISPVAKRIFLTLSNWRSAIPVLAIQAVLMRPENESMDINYGINELSRSSFVEIKNSINDGYEFLSVPLSASLYGKRKLTASPMKIAIENDMPFLHAFGATQLSEINRGIGPRVDRLFRYIADKIAKDKNAIIYFLPVITFIAQKHPKAWMLLSELYEESGEQDSNEKAIDALIKYLEYTESEYQSYGSWEKLSYMYKKKKDWHGEMYALVEMTQILTTPFSNIHNAARRINSLLRHEYINFSPGEKQIMVEKVIKVMEDRISEGDADSCSTLAWLFLNNNEEDRAIHYASKGIIMNPQNYYCQRLVDKLGTPKTE